MEKEAVQESSRPHEIVVPITLKLQEAPDIPSNFNNFGINDTRILMSVADEQGRKRIVGGAMVCHGGVVEFKFEPEGVKYGVFFSDIWKAVGEQLSNLEVPQVKEISELDEISSSSSE